MKNLKFITLIALFTCIPVFLLTLTDFLALHDIFNDYASPKVISRFCASDPTGLPHWTRTTMEWQMVNISYVARFFFLIFNTVVLIYFIRVIDTLKKIEGN